MCAPEFQFHFHGECQPNILTPNRSVDRNSAAGNEKDNFLPSFIFLLVRFRRSSLGLRANDNPLKSVLELMTEWG